MENCRVPLNMRVLVSRLCRNSPPEITWLSLPLFWTFPEFAFITLLFLLAVVLPHVLVTAPVRMVCLLRCAALWWPVTSDLSAVLPVSSSVCWSHMWLTPAPLCACSRPPCTASRRENTSCAAPLGLALGPWYSLFLPLERTSFWVLIAAAVHNNNKKWIILWVIQFVSYFCNKSSWVLEARFSISHLPSGELIW